MCVRKCAEAISEEKIQRRDVRQQTPKEVKAVVILLYIFAGFSVFALLAGEIHMIIPIVLNLVLANGLLKMKSWARIWTLARTVIGMIVTLISLADLCGAQGVSGDEVALLWVLSLVDLACFLTIIVMLTKAKIRKANWA